MRQRILLIAALLISSGAIAQTSAPSQPDSHSLPAPSVSGATTFEERWDETKAGSPKTTEPRTQTIDEATGFGPGVSKRMGPEMESAADSHPVPDNQ
jgi:hypothetical protein